MGTLRSRLGYAAVVIAVFFVAERLNDLLWRLDAFHETALGGGLANAARILAMLLAIALTLLKGRIWRSERAEKQAYDEGVDRGLSGL